MRTVFYCAAEVAEELLQCAAAHGITEESLAAAPPVMIPAGAAAADAIAAAQVSKEQGPALGSPSRQP